MEHHLPRKAVSPIKRMKASGEQSGHGGEERASYGNYSSAQNSGSGNGSSHNLKKSPKKMMMNLPPKCKRSNGSSEKKQRSKIAEDYNSSASRQNEHSEVNAGVQLRKVEEIEEDIVEDKPLNSA